MLDLLKEFINNEPLYYGSIIALCVLFLVTIFVLIIEKRNRVKRVKKYSQRDFLTELNLMEQELSKKPELIEEAKPANELEEMISKMAKDLEVKEENDVFAFEQEQEEKAVISYQELLEKAQTDKEEIQEPINLVDDNPNEGLEKDKKFKNTTFISPIFGVVDNQINYPTIKSFKAKEDVLENVLSIDVLDENIRKNEEFLETLKEFRRNL